MLHDSPNSELLRATPHSPLLSADIVEVWLADSDGVGADMLPTLLADIFCRYFVSADMLAVHQGCQHCRLFADKPCHTFVGRQPTLLTDIVSRQNDNRNVGRQWRAMCRGS